MFLFSFAGCIGSILMLRRGEDNPVWWLSFTVFEGLSFAGILTIYSTHVLKHAAMSTCALCGGLTAAGAVAPSEDVLWLHGPLLSASFGILGISIMRIFAPCPMLNILVVYLIRARASVRNFDGRMKAICLITPCWQST
eukprot:COSAG02_NODE_8442_length_2569_cov_1.587854_3_plen_139_part_00